MGRTVTEKTLAEHSQDPVAPGEFVRARVDLVVANDITSPIAIDKFKKIGKAPFDPERILIIPDHLTPCKDIASAELCRKVRAFARENQIRYYEVGRCGIEHAFLPEQGLVVPGDVVIGGDSHTCTHGAIGAFATGMGSTDIGVAMAVGETWLKVPESMRLIYNGTPQEHVCGKDLILHTIGDIGVSGALYRAMEFSGDALRQLSMDDRFTLCNMAVEAGAKAGIIEADEMTTTYVKKRAKRPYKIHRSDEDAEYCQTIEYDVSKIVPQIALPHSPGNVIPVTEAEGIPVDQVVIGSCTNGRVEDMRAAARILENNTVAEGLRAIIIPATQDIYMQCSREGLIDIFIKAGAFVSGPTCGPCIGGHMGVLAKGERCVSTTNRNFIGRMGHKTSEVYLASPATAAASAIKGKITQPKEIAG